MITNSSVTTEQLSTKLNDFLSLAAKKVSALLQAYDATAGTPVYTVDGTYTSRGWTEWTQGFLFGMPILLFEATGDKQFLNLGRDLTVKHMAAHVTHFGVHDHGFNNVSTYGNLLRLMNEGRIPENAWEREFYQIALRSSGAVQAKRWTSLLGCKNVKLSSHVEPGYVCSFNGPHSLFVDTMRSMRALAIAHGLGHRLLDENDKSISLLERIISHAWTTAQVSIYYGDGRDSYDEFGRTAQESIFNLNDRNYRCPSTQQGFSPFSTWTRGQAWIILGYPEQLEFLATLDDSEFADFGGREWVTEFMLKAAIATADHYIANTPVDGIPYWDTSAPGLSQMPDHKDKAADPFNAYEPVDSSAATVACQGLLRLGHYLAEQGRQEEADKYLQAGKTTLNTLLSEPYVSSSEQHQGLILHSVYHRPNGWDNVPAGQKVPCGESSLWGDYHALETAVYMQRLIKGDKTYPAFYNAINS